MEYYKVLVSSKSAPRKLQSYKHDTFYKENVKAGEEPSYESLYLYNDDHKKQLASSKKLAGIKNVVANKIVFDFDSKTDQELALKDAKTLAATLKSNVQADAIRCYFSGNKGYHVEIHFNDGEYINRNQFESIINNFACHLPTFDSAIKDEQRIFRMPFSKHEESGLYKIPIEVNDFIRPELTHKEIAARSTKENLESLKLIFDDYKTVPIPQIFHGAMHSVDAKLSKAKAEALKDRPDMTEKPKHLSAAKFALMKGYFDEGERNEACMALCATFRGLGYPKEICYNMLKATLRMRADRLGLEDYDKNELYKEVIDVVFSPNWKGGVYSEKEGILLKTIETYGLQKSTSNDVGLLKIDDLHDVFAEFARDIDKNTIKLGIDEIDAKLRITTSNFVCLLAPPSAGKTSISLGILNTLSNSEEKAIFFSMDMAIPQVYQRLVQRHTGEFSTAITDNYKNGITESTAQYINILQNSYKNIKMCFKTGLNAETIRETIINEFDVTGIMPRLVIIDYLECIAGPFTDSTANKALIATQLKDIANELGICVLLIVQPAKVSGDPSQELDSYTQIKGSSVLGEAATIVMAMYRPGFSPKHPEWDKYLTINVVKNRMGELSSTDLAWEGVRGSVRSLSAEEKTELANLRATIAAIKSGESMDSSDSSAASRLFPTAGAANRREVY